MKKFILPIAAFLLLTVFSANAFAAPGQPLAEPTEDTPTKILTYAYFTIAMDLTPMMNAYVNNVQLVNNDSDKADTKLIMDLGLRFNQAWMALEKIMAVLGKDAEKLQGPHKAMGATVKALTKYSKDSTEENLKAFKDAQTKLGVEMLVFGEMFTMKELMGEDMK